MPPKPPRLAGVEIAVAAALTALLDQASKASAQAFLQGHPSQPIIKGVLHFTYIQNTGAAFGMLRDSGFLLSAISLVFLLAVVLFGATTPLSSRGMRLALGAGIGGAVSNLIDRFTKGYVVDFIDFRVWPVFNLADIAIVLGLGLLCVRFVFRGPAATRPHGSQDTQERTDDNAS